MSSTSSPQQNGGDVSNEIYDVGSAIPLLAFQICIGVFYGLAFISVCARSVMRIATRRPLYWDDFFLAVGIASLTVVTGLLYKNLNSYYILRALLLHPELAASLPKTELEDLLNNSLPKEYSTDSLLWTTIFCVKASFLVISRQLMQRLPWMNVYFWTVTALTGVSWAFLLCSPFIECPYTGLESANCTTASHEVIYIVVTGLSAGLDILTDLLVASIPIIILLRSKLDSKQKLIIGPFLSLSLIMVIFAIVRVSKIQSSAHLDMGWLGFWQYLEAAIAIIVTSITTIRTVFTARKARKTQQANTRSDRISPKYTKTTNTGGSANTSTGYDEDIQLMEPHGVSNPSAPARIMVQDTWDVTYDKRLSTVKEVP